MALFKTEILHSLSNEIGLDRKHDQARPQIQPFLKKKHIFRPKFMVFLKIFFAQKKEQKKLHRVAPTKFI